MEVNVMDYIVKQSFILIPVLYILGIMLKTTEKVNDWIIPWLLLVFGITGAIALMGFNINAIFQGILVTGATVYANQLIKQSRRK